MPVAGDDGIGIRCNGAFQDAVVRFVFPNDAQPLLGINPVGLPDEVGGQRGWGRLLGPTLRYRLTHTVTLRFGVRSGQRAGMDTLSLQDAVMVCAAIRITCTFFGSKKSEPGDV